MSTYYLYNDELYHYGVKGMRWGVRRYQNKDGSLTALGKKHQAMRDSRDEFRKANKEYNRSFNKAYGRRASAISPSKNQRAASKKRWDDTYEKYETARKAGEKFKQSKREYRDAKREIANAGKQKSGRFVEQQSSKFPAAKKFVNSMGEMIVTAEKNQLRAEYGLEDFYND